MTSTPLPIFDGHNDTLLRLYRTGLPVSAFFERGQDGHIDLPRAKQGGFAGGLFACFVPSDTPDQDLPASDKGGYSVPFPGTPAGERALAVTNALAARLQRLARASGGQVSVCRSVADIRASLASGSLAAVLHIEGAEAIDPDMEALEVLYAAGLRSLGPVWSRPNIWGHGVPFRFPSPPDTGPGLTDAGKALVRACNELRIMLDLSHLNEAGFWDVAEISDAPLVATHSNAHALCPATRNLTDEQLDAIGRSGGIVGINFAVSFLREDGSQDSSTPLSEIVRHVDYIANRIGIDHVAFGSDFDGAVVSDELGGLAGLPKLVAALQDAGYDEDAVAKVTHGNWLRIFRATWR